jgi:hypothetical protein
MCMGCIRHIPPDGQGVTFTLTESTAIGITYISGCTCSGTIFGCAGHVGVTLSGYQGPAQHTYTPACDGFHEPGPCPPSQPAVQITRDKQEDSS